MNKKTICSLCGQDYYKNSRGLYGQSIPKNAPDCPSCYKIFNINQSGNWKKIIIDLLNKIQSDPHKNHKTRKSTYSTDFLYCPNCHVAYKPPEEMPFMQTKPMESRQLRAKSMTYFGTA